MFALKYYTRVTNVGTCESRGTNCDQGQFLWLPVFDFMFQSSKVHVKWARLGMTYMYIQTKAGDKVNDKQMQYNINCIKYFKSIKHDYTEGRVLGNLRAEQSAPALQKLHGYFNQ